MPTQTNDSKPRKGRILVIRGGAIGDFILTLPAIAAIREQFPEAHLELLGYPHIAQLAVAGHLVDQLQSIEARALAGFFARGSTRLDEKLAGYFGSFHLIISYLYDPDEIFKTNVARCSGAQFIVGPHRPKEDGIIHATDTFLKPLERLAIFDADAAPRLSLPRATELSGGSANPPNRWLALHPGSGSERKNWPETKWIELLAQLRDSTALNFLLVGGEAEGTRLARLGAGLPEGRVRFAQQLALAELAALVQTCGMFVGHDSGISHLAAALGLRGVVLWGPSNEKVWRPRSDRFQLVQHPDGLAKLEVQRVVAEILAMCEPRTEP